MGKKASESETEHFKHILIQAYQKGERSANITTKDMIEELIVQLQHFFKANKK
jgi:FMN-dependent NADH-azoreductase